MDSEYALDALRIAYCDLDVGFLVKAGIREDRIAFQEDTTNSIYRRFIFGFSNTVNDSNHGAVELNIRPTQALRLSGEFKAAARAGLPEVDAWAKPVVVVSALSKSSIAKQSLRDLAVTAVVPEDKGRGQLMH